MWIKRLLAVAAVWSFANGALASPTEVSFANRAACDVLSVPRFVDELGTTPGFDLLADELITATSITPSPSSACPSQDDPTVDNVLVSIVNTTGRTFSDLWYVADPPDATTGFGGATLGNRDGVINDATGTGVGGLAFKIDRIGFNRPLIFESMTVDAIFEPNEQWDFVITDFVSLMGLLPAVPELMGSVGVGELSGGLTGDPSSTGSILAIERVVAPEPAALAFLLLGLLSLGRRRR